MKLVELTLWTMLHTVQCTPSMRPGQLVMSLLLSSHVLPQAASLPAGCITARSTCSITCVVERRDVVLPQSSRPAWAEQAPTMHMLPLIVSVIPHHISQTLEAHLRGIRRSHSMTLQCAVSCIAIPNQQRLSSGCSCPAALHTLHMQPACDCVQHAELSARCAAAASCSFRTLASKKVAHASLRQRIVASAVQAALAATRTHATRQCKKPLSCAPC